MKHMRWGLCLLLASLGLGGCSDDDAQTKEKKGALGDVTFAYLCGKTIQNDPYCDPQVQNPAFPVIAQGSKFQVGADHVFFPSVDGRLAEIGRSEEAIGSYKSHEFLAIAAGYTALISDNDEGADYLDVLVKPIATLRLELTEVSVTDGWRLDSTLSTDPDELNAKLIESKHKEFYLRAAPLSAEGEPLGGAVAEGWSWTSSNEAAVRVDTTNGAHLAKLTKVAPGTATIRVRVGGLEAAIDLEGEVMP